MKYFDIAYVGAGPATMFSVLHLLKKGYEGNIAIIEAGESLETRPKNEVIKGVFGAGSFSDSKLTVSLDVGGNIPNLTQEELDEYSDKILSYINEFKMLTHNYNMYNWDNTTSYDTSPSSLKWNIHKTCHIGTDNGQAIYYEIEKYIKSHENIELITKTTVKDVFQLNNNYFQLITDNRNYVTVVTKKLVIATGQKGRLVGDIVNKFNLSKIPRAFQLGVRVEDIINPQYEKILKANYDFKFEKDYYYPNNIKVRVRTFCCNSGNAHTCAERASDGYICFNGHSYKTPDPNNHTVNYGIICEATGLNFNTKEDQINLIKSINSIEGWEEDNLDSKGNPSPKSKLLKGFDKLKGYYPDEIIYSLEDFTQNLNKVVDLKNAHYLYPEIKLNDGYSPKLDKNYMSEIKNIYMIGDCAYTRGIIKAAIMGMKFANYIVGGNK